MGRSNYVVTFFVALFLCATMVPSAFAEEPPPPTETTTTTTTVPPDESEPPVDPDEGEVRTPPDPVERIEVVRNLIFPIVGPTYYYRGFGACRDNCTREHHGVDIMSWNWKGLAVVAAHDGVVTRVTYDKGNAGCSVRIRSRDRWETRYLHLNNDLPGTDEIGAQCPAAGIEVGTRVSAGQVIAWVGDSGNAETTPPHIHFELRTPGGHPVDPYESLRKASRVTYEWLPSNMSEASLIITGAYKPETNGTTIVVTTDEAHRLTESEFDAMTLMAPVVVIDPGNPMPALDEIARLASRAITIMSDENVQWLENSLAQVTAIIDRVSIPEFQDETANFVPDSDEVPTIGPNIEDRFTTIIAGRIERIRKSRIDELEDFSKSHQSLILHSASWGRKYLGQRSWVSPGRYADRTLLWWPTGNGWVGTESMNDIPSQGIAYVTEGRATPWTFAYLASLAELDQMPIWRSR